jgi:spoIIIJ-associated protein
MKNIFVGKTIDEAKMKASEAFGVPVEDITFTVLEEPKKGLFGLIKSEAKIEAEYVSGDTSEEAVSDNYTAEVPEADA